MKKEVDYMEMIERLIHESGAGFGDDKIDEISTCETTYSHQIVFHFKDGEYMVFTCRKD